MLVSFRIAILWCNINPNFSLFYKIRTLFLAHATCPPNVDCNSALHHLHSGIQLMEHCCLKYFQSVEEKKRDVMWNHMMLLNTPVHMVHMLYSSLLQAKANLCHCLASSRRGSKSSLSWKHPVSVENSAVQQNVLKYIIYINLNSGLIVIGPTRSSLILLCRPHKQIINHSDLWDWPNWPKGILLSHWCLSSQSCKTTGLQTSGYLTIPSENFYWWGIRKTPS